MNSWYSCSEQLFSFEFFCFQTSKYVEFWFSVGADSLIAMFVYSQSFPRRLFILRPNLLLPLKYSEFDWGKIS